jgi:hypothetical protein
MQLCVCLAEDGGSPCRRYNFNTPSVGMPPVLGMLTKMVM